MSNGREPALPIAADSSPALSHRAHPRPPIEGYIRFWKQGTFVFELPLGALDNWEAVAPCVVRVYSKVKVRLPLLEEVPALIRQHMARVHNVSNRHYVYVCPVGEGDTIEEIFEGQWVIWGANPYTGGDTHE